MKKISFILTLFSCIQLLFSQDVTIYVEGIYNGDPLHLDSILIINLSQASSITFTNLPEEVVLYEINLSKGILNSIERSFNPKAEFSLYAANFGEIWLNVSVTHQVRTQAQLYTLSGALVNEESFVVGPETGFIHVTTGNQPMYILQVIFESSSYSVKILGNKVTSSTSKIEMINRINQPVLKSSLEPSFSDFLYSPGDTIDVFTFKENMYPGERIIKPYNNVTISTFLSLPCPEIPIVYDYDGNAYPTIRLGDQCWLKENLRTIHYNDGTPLVDGTNAGDISNDYTTPYWFYPMNNPENDQLFGKLYSGSIIYHYPNIENTENNKEICPQGWHVASDHEWMILEAFLGMGADTSGIYWRGTNEGAKIKNPSDFFFFPPDHGATNESGFDARGAGYRSSHDFGAFKVYNTWWTSTSWGNNYIMTRMVSGGSSSIYRGIVLSDGGFSIRCVKN